MMPMLAEMLPLLVTYISLHTVTNRVWGLEMLAYIMGRNMYSGFTDFLGTILGVKLLMQLIARLQFGGLISHYNE